MAPLVQFAFAASVGLASMTSAATSSSARELSQADLENPVAVVQSLAAGIDQDRKRSADSLLVLGEKYQRRALRDGNWSPAAKAFGESALLYPRAAVLVRYAESMLRAEARKAAALGLEPQMELLRRTANVYGSALAADDHAPHLTQAQREELVRTLQCSRQYLNERKAVAGCSTLRLMGIVGKGGRP